MKSVMPSRALTSAVCLACFLLPAMAVEGGSLAARKWVTSLVSRVGEAVRPDSIDPANKQQMVEIRVRVAVDGSILNVVVELPSVDEVLEKRIKAAVAATGPFEPPPGELLAADGSTELSFPIETGEAR